MGALQALAVWRRAAGQVSGWRAARVAHLVQAEPGAPAQAARAAARLALLAGARMCAVECLLLVLLFAKGEWGVNVSARDLEAQAAGVVP